MVRPQPHLPDCLYTFPISHIRSSLWPSVQDFVYIGKSLLDLYLLSVPTERLVESVLLYLLSSCPGATLNALGSRRTGQTSVSLRKQRQKKKKRKKKSKEDASTHKTTFSIQEGAVLTASDIRGCDGHVIQMELYRTLLVISLILYCSHAGSIHFQFNPIRS